MSVAPGAAGRKALLDPLGLALARCVVGVDERRLEVAVTHHLLEDAQRDALRGHAGAEGVAQVVEANLANLSCQAPKGARNHP